MGTSFNWKNKSWLLMPMVGIILYVLLYVVSTFFYPGGNQVDKNFKGFSWSQNYWCNLLNENAINGRHNPARPVALIGMVIFSFSLIYFFYIFPILTEFNNPGKLIIQLSGFLAMTLGFFLFTHYHDIIINIATLFGLVAIAGTFIGLQKLKWKKLFWTGIFNIILIAVNNILYYNEGLIFYLPVIQKISFLYFLVWLCIIDMNLYKNANAWTIKNRPKFN